MLTLLLTLTLYCVMKVWKLLNTHYSCGIDGKLSRNYKASNSEILENLSCIMIAQTMERVNSFRTNSITAVERVKGVISSKMCCNNSYLELQELMEQIECLNMKNETMTTSFQAMHEDCDKYHTQNKVR